MNYSKFSIGLNKRFSQLFRDRAIPLVAETFYQTFTERLLEGNDPIVYTLRAQVNNRLGESQKAIADAEVAIKNLDTWEEAYIERARAHISLGQFDDALKDLKNVKEKSPVSHFYMGEALRGVGKAREALAQYELALDLAPVPGQKASLINLVYAIKAEKRLIESGMPLETSHEQGVLESGRISQPGLKHLMEYI